MAEPSDPAQAPPALFDNRETGCVFVLGVLSLAVCAASACLLYLSAAEVVEQHRVMASLVPVQATVISARSGPQPWARRSQARLSVLTQVLFGPDHEVWVSYRRWRHLHQRGSGADGRAGQDGERPVPRPLERAGRPPDPVAAAIPRRPGVVGGGRCAPPRPRPELPGVL
jgi:hypothetical protein